jgi:hypothetical protein
MSRSSAGRSSRWNSFRRSFPSCRPQKLWRFFLALVFSMRGSQHSFDTFPIPFATNVNRPSALQHAPRAFAFRGLEHQDNGAPRCKTPADRAVLESGGIGPASPPGSQSNTTVKSQLHTNDTVRFSGEIWRVVTTINGSKADLQRLNSSNPRIITVAVDSLNVEVVQRFGSPNSSF